MGVISLCVLSPSISSCAAGIRAHAADGLAALSCNRCKQRLSQVRYSAFLEDLGVALRSYKQRGALPAALD